MLTNEVGGPDNFVAVLTPSGWDAKIEDFEHFGTSIPKDVTNFTMDRAVRGRPLTKDQKERNRKISAVRSPGERPFSVIKTVFA